MPYFCPMLRLEGDYLPSMEKGVAGTHALGYYDIYTDLYGYAQSTLFTQSSISRDYTVGKLFVTS